MSTFEQQVSDVRKWFESARFKGIVRLHTPREVAEQRGGIPTDYPIARDAAEGFHARLRELFERREPITLGRGSSCVLVCSRSLCSRSCSRFRH